MRDRITCSVVPDRTVNGVRGTSKEAGNAPGFAGFRTAYRNPLTPTGGVTLITRGFPRFHPAPHDQPPSPGSGFRDGDPLAAERAIRPIPANPGRNLSILGESYADDAEIAGVEFWALAELGMLSP